MVGGRIRVGEGLEISKIPHFRIFASEEAFALFQLLGNAERGFAIGWIESLVVAEGASAYSHPTIAIGACEPRIDGNLLNPKRELASDPRTVVDIELVAHL